MPSPSTLTRLLVDLIRMHDAGHTEPLPPAGTNRPRLRLQDWQVVDHVSVDTSEYVLLRRVQAPRGMDGLTSRERDAVLHACTGASNKDIAHEMGISDSTVGVLLLRACRRLGAADRAQLIDRVRAGEGAAEGEAGCARLQDWLDRKNHLRSHRK